MGDRCDISDLLGEGRCPVCATAAPTDVTLDAWDELRALARGPEPEPLVLPIRG